MDVSNEIIHLAKENYGMITSAMIDAAGFSRGSLKYLTDIGALENTMRGVYVLPDVWEDEMYSLQCRYKKGIYSGETALFLWDLTDRTPVSYSMTFPSSYNTTSAKRENIRCRMVKEPFYSLGTAEMQTPGFHMVKCYNMEKTLCDILKPQANTDIQLISEAFKTYVKRSDRNIPRLSEYAKLLKVEKRIRTYLEVLL